MAEPGALDAFRAAREAGDAGAMARAALRLPHELRFGAHPGRIPALLHEAYRVAPAPTVRARLAAALARAWVYGGDAERAVVFACEAETLAASSDDPEVQADALDAALLVRWGPDAFAERVGLAARLSDLAAHVDDREIRLSAHLWRLTTAWECLDVLAVQRQLRALDVLAAETAWPRAGFFAVARRAMYALATGALDVADELVERAREMGAEVGEPDLDAVVHSLVVNRALQTHAVPVLAAEAAVFEAYGEAEGIASVLAEAAVLWHAAGDDTRAAALVHRVAGAGLGAVPRDVDFLLVVASVTAVAAAVGIVDVLPGAIELLEPCAGRAVLNAGAVTFHGVVDDYLWRAGRVVGDSRAEGWRRAALSSYRRVGAPWWAARLEQATPASSPATLTVHLQRERGGGWRVGAPGATFTLPDLKGLRYVRELVARPDVEIEAAELADAVAGHPVAGVREPSLGPLLDERAVAAYRRRLADLDREIGAADASAATMRRERLEDERDALMGELRAAVGLGGRARTSGGTAERARVAVRKAIATAIGRVGSVDPVLGRLLDDTVETGTRCCYRPDPGRPTTWVLDDQGWV